MSNFSIFWLSGQKISSGRVKKYPGRPLIYCGSEVCSGRVGSGPISITRPNSFLLKFFDDQNLFLKSKHYLALKTSGHYFSLLKFKDYVLSKKKWDGPTPQYHIYSKNAQRTFLCLTKEQNDILKSERRLIDISELTFLFCEIKCKENFFCDI